MSGKRATIFIKDELIAYTGSLPGNNCSGKINTLAGLGWIVYNKYKQYINVDNIQITVINLAKNTDLSTPEIIDIAELLHQL